MHFSRNPTDVSCAGCFVRRNLELLEWSLRANEINKIVNRKYQTLSYYGISIEKLNEFVEFEKPIGIDRIVPIG